MATIIGGTVAYEVTIPREQVQKAKSQARAAGQELNKALNGSQTGGSRREISALDKQIRDLALSVRNTRNAYIQGRIGQDEYRTSAGRLKAELNGLLNTNKLNIAQQTKANTAAATAERGLAGLRGEMSRLGLASQVQLGLQTTLSSQLYRFGPAGSAAALGITAFSAAQRKAAVASTTTNAVLQTQLITLGALLGPIGVVVAAFAVLTAGTALVGAASTGAAASIEQLEAAVSKTSGLSAPGLDALTNRLQNVSTQIGVSTQSLLEISVVAGQLGVRGVEDITDFTTVLGKLQIATDIVGEEGAKTLARFINVTKDASESVGDSATRVGNVVNALGNSLAATEGEILTVAGRVGQLKQIANVSQTEILALAGSLAAVGINAELGGSALTRLFIDLQENARKGGAALEIYSRLTGQTAEDFKALVRSNPAQAFEDFVGGLKRAKDGGAELIPILESVGITQIRERETILKLVGGYEVLTRARKTASDEAEKQTSIDKEVARQNDTLIAQYNILRQRIGVAVQVTGEAFIPVLRGLVDTLNKNTEVLGSVVAGIYAVVASFEYVSTVASAFGTVISATFNGIDAAAQSVADNIRAYFVSSFSITGDALRNFATFAQDVLKNPLQAVQAYKAATAELEQKRTVAAYSDPYAAFAEGYNSAGGTEAFLSINDAAERLLGTFGNLDEIAARATGTIVTGFEEADERVRSAIEANLGMSDTLDDLGGSGEKAGKKIRTVADVLKDLKDKLGNAAAQGALFGAQFDVAQAQSDAVKDALRELVSAPFSLDPQSSQVQKLVDQLLKLEEILAKPDRAAKIWVARLGDELESGTKNAAEVLDLLNPRVEELQASLKDKQQNGLYGAQAYNDDKARLEALVGLRDKAAAVVEENRSAYDEARAANEKLFRDAFKADQDAEEARLAKRSERAGVLNDYYQYQLEQQKHWLAQGVKAEEEAAEKRNEAYRRAFSGSASSVAGSDAQFANLGGDQRAPSGYLQGDLDRRAAQVKAQEDTLTRIRDDAWAARYVAASAYYDALQKREEEQRRTLVGNRALVAGQASQASAGRYAAAGDYYERTEGAREKGLEIYRASLKETTALQSAFGASYDFLGARIQAVTAYINTLISSGLDPQGERVQEQVDLWGQLNDAQGIQADTLKAQADAQKRASNALEGYRDVQTEILGLTGRAPDKFDKMRDAVREAFDTDQIDDEELAAALKQIDGLDKIAAVTAGLELGTNIVNGLTQTLNAKGVEGALSGLTSIGSSLGSAIGGPLVGSLVGAIGAGLQSVVGLFQSIFHPGGAARKAVFEGLQSSIYSGFSSGANKYLQTGNIDDLQKGIEGGIFQGVSDALIKSLFETSIFETALNPLIKQFAAALVAGDDARAAGIAAQLKALVPELTNIAKTGLDLIAPLAPGKEDGPAGATQNGGTQISELTGPSRDLLSDLLSPLANLDAIPTGLARIADILTQRLPLPGGGTLGAATANNATAGGQVNNFYISGTDPQAVASIVMDKLNRQTEISRRSR